MGFVYDLGLVAVSTCFFFHIPTVYLDQCNFNKNAHNSSVNTLLHFFRVNFKIQIFIFFFGDQKLNWKEEPKKSLYCTMAKCLLMTFAKLLSPHNKTHQHNIAKHRGHCSLCHNISPRNTQIQHKSNMFYIRLMQILEIHRFCGKIKVFAEIEKHNSFAFVLCISL